MKIIKFEATNVKRLRAVEIRPDSSTVVIGGKNGAGKSSVIDGIAYTIGGKKLCPKVPIRRGEDEADTALDLGDIRVSRHWVKDGRTDLTVTSPDGAKYPSPQRILDELLGPTPLSFDPIEFSRMAPAKQAEILRELVGLDFAELDTRRQAAYDSQTVVNRDLKAAKAQLDGMTHHEDAPAEPVSVANLMRDLEGRRAANRANEDRRRDIAYRRTELQREAKAAKDAEVSAIEVATDLRLAQQKRVAELRAELADAERELTAVHETADANIAAAKEAMERTATALAVGSAKLGAEAEQLVDQPTDDLVAEIAGAEDVNRKVRESATREAQANKVTMLQEESDEWTAKIEACDAERLATTEAATFPIEGLGVTDDGVTLDGLPLEQAGSAERIRVGVAMALALTPKLPIVLVRDGSLLDEDSLQFVQTMVSKVKDGQLWIERVGTGGATVVIEDGTIAGADTEASE